MKRKICLLLTLATILTCSTSCGKKQQVDESITESIQNESTDIEEILGSDEDSSQVKEISVEEGIKLYNSAFDKAFSLDNYTITKNTSTTVNIKEKGEYTTVEKNQLMLSKEDFHFITDSLITLPDDTTRKNDSCRLWYQNGIYYQNIIMPGSDELYFKEAVDHDIQLKNLQNIIIGESEEGENFNKFIANASVRSVDGQSHILFELEHKELSSYLKSEYANEENKDNIEISDAQIDMQLDSDGTLKKTTSVIKMITGNFSLYRTETITLTDVGTTETPVLIASEKEKYIDVSEEKTE